VIDYCAQNYNYTLADMNQRFNDRAQKVLNEVLPSIFDTSVRSILDIGCGIGGNSAMLANAVGAKTVHLIEGDANPEVIAALKEHGLGYSSDKLKPWNDVEIAAELVRANVARDVVVVPHKAADVLAGTHDMPDSFDLITSFRSWCHHYPARVYLDIVRDRMMPGYSRLVVDIRTNTNNLGVLEAAGFDVMSWVSQNSASEKKTRRYVLRYYNRG
jgi:SAM-dependent methyltransferase